MTLLLSAQLPTYRFGLSSMPPSQLFRLLLVPPPPLVQCLSNSSREREKPRPIIALGSACQQINRDFVCVQRRSLVTFADVILPSRACSCSPFDFCFLVISSCSLEKKKWMASQGKKTCHVVWLFCFCFVFFAVAFFRLRMRNKPLKHNPLSFFLFLRHRPLANRLPVSRLSSLFFLFFFFCVCGLVIVRLENTRRSLYGMDGN